MSLNEVANEGFLVLGERSRNPQDKEFIRNTIQKIFKC
jgi:midasin (ATPase involved in ribosome maturation)